MKIAFCLFKYFPYGGLQRDFLRIAKACRARGHEIHVYTSHWEGEVDPDFHLHFIQVNSWQNHTRNKMFAENVKHYLASLRPDVVVGFNKMPYLDVYYAADVCYQARVHERHGFIYKLLPRYRQLMALEESVFARDKKTEIMLISPAQQPEFERYYQTEKNRFHILPPGISKDRKAPLNSAEIRASIRAAHQLSEKEFLLLMIGSGFKTKGLDRAILGLASLPEDLKIRTRLFVIGQDNPNRFIKLAKHLKVDKQLMFLGGRDDVPQFLLAADLLVHPAYHENTGTVLLEAVIAGLPVLTTDVCGYAHYIKTANAGKVINSPFQQVELNAILKEMLLSPDILSWQKNGLAFAENADIYNLPEKAADLIENVRQKRLHR